MGTGDGSKLVEPAPLPARTVADENWAPTVPAALATLRPAGVGLVGAARGHPGEHQEHRGRRVPVRTWWTDVDALLAYHSFWVVAGKAS